MNIVVCVKQVPDTAQDIKLDDQGRLIRKGLSLKTNDWDEYALEESLLMREKHGGEVTVITVGPEKAERSVRDCMAKGADKAIRIWDDSLEEADSNTIAFLLSQQIKTMDWDLVLTGMQTEDDGWALVGLSLAHKLGVPCATMVTKIEPQDRTLIVERELEGGVREVLETEMPAVLTIQTGINIPRYASLMGIKNSMKKSVELLAPSDFGLTDDSVAESLRQTKVEEMYIPVVEKYAEIIEGKPEEAGTRLMELLVEKGVV